MKKGKKFYGHRGDEYIFSRHSPKRFTFQVIDMKRLYFQFVDVLNPSVGFQQNLSKNTISIILNKNMSHYSRFHVNYYMKAN